MNHFIWPTVRCWTCYPRNPCLPRTLNALTWTHWIGIFLSRNQQETMLPQPWSSSNWTCTLKKTWCFCKRACNKCTCFKQKGEGISRKSYLIAMSDWRGCTVYSSLWMVICHLLSAFCKQICSVRGQSAITFLETLKLVNWVPQNCNCRFSFFLKYW
jgi:hypothetical protein